MKAILHCSDASVANVKLKHYKNTINRNHGINTKIKIKFNIAEYAMLCSHYILKGTTKANKQLIRHANCIELVLRMFHLLFHSLQCY